MPVRVERAGPHSVWGQALGESGAATATPRT